MLQGDEAHSRRHILSEIQFTNAHPPGERRGEHFLGDDRADPFGGGGGRIARGLGGIEIRLGGVAALNQLTLSFERQVGVLEDREIILEIGLLHRIVDFKKRGALFNVLARLDADRYDRSADLRRDIDFLHRPEGPNRRQARRPGLDFGHGDRDRSGGRRRL